jgi:hypothetical protein
MFGHHGFIGENVPLGVGAALGSGRPTLCLFGDGAAEEDYVFAAMGFAVTHKLPVLFVCEDNDLSILTPVHKRRSWSMTKVAEALGMPTFELADDPWTIAHRTEGLKTRLPAFLNCLTCRAIWHVGVGNDGPAEWDRFDMVKADLMGSGLAAEASRMENEIQESMKALWNRRHLPIRFEKSRETT